MGTKQRNRRQGLIAGLRGESTGAVEHLEPRQMLSTSIRFEGASLGTLGAAQTPVAPVFADFNGDGTPDMVYGEGRSILFRSGQGGGRFALPSVAAVLNQNVGLLKVAELDATGTLDLVSVGASQSGLSSWVRTLTSRLGRGGAVLFNVQGARRIEGTASSLTTGSLEDGATIALVPVVRPALSIAITTRDPGQGDVQGRDRLYYTSTTLPGGLTVPRLLEDAMHVTQASIGDANADGRPELAYAVMQSGQTSSTVKIVRKEGLNFGTLASRQLQGEVQSVLLDDVSLSATSEGRVYVTTMVQDLSDTAAWLGTVLRMTFTTENPSGPMLSQGDPIYNKQFAATGSLVDRVGTPSLRILSIGDYNGDAITDLALQADDTTATTGLLSLQERTSDLIMLYGDLPRPQEGQLPPPTGFRSVFFQRSSATGPGGASVISRPEFDVYSFAGVRRSDRQDLIVIRQGEFGGLAEVRVHLNTEAIKPGRVSELSSFATSALPANLPPATFPVGTGWQLDAAVVFPELQRFDFVASVKAYRDSNNNGVLDASDQEVGQMQPPTTLVGLDEPDVISRWTLNFTLLSGWVGQARFFVQAQSGNGVLGPVRATESIAIIA